MFGIDGLTFLDSAALVAQTGFAKSMLGYVAVGVLIAVGLSLMLRPSGRPTEKKKK